MGLDALGLASERIPDGREQVLRDEAEGSVLREMVAHDIGEVHIVVFGVGRGEDETRRQREHQGAACRARRSSDTFVQPAGLRGAGALGGSSKRHGLSLLDSRRAEKLQTHPSDLLGDGAAARVA